MGLRATQHIGRVLIDPVDPDTVYVAALGRLWGPTERGVFKTTDGGRTWTNVKFIDQDTGFVDMVMDPANRQVLYAAAYQRRRAPWGFNGGGPGGGIYKTVDGGRTWTKLTSGLPTGTTAASAWPSGGGIRACSTPPWSTGPRAARFDRTMAARRGAR